MRIEQKQLKEFILDSGLVSRADLERAQEEAAATKTDIGAVLVGKGLITDDEMRRLEAYVLGVPFVELKDEKIPFETLSLIPEPIARNHNIVAFKQTEGGLEVAMLDTEDLEAIDFIRKKTRLRILPRLTDAASIKAALKQYQQELKDNLGDVIQRETEALRTSGVGEGAGEGVWGHS